jgi:galactokinase
VLTGGPPQGVWSAPGRVNIIGEHTDYNGGRALPFAIPLRASVAIARRSDAELRCWTPQDPGRGGAYVAGTVSALRAAGVPTGGLDVVVGGTVPLGAGLASSAALTCAVAVAVNNLVGAGLDRMALARAAQRAEHEEIGAPVGLMDQVAALFGQKGSAVLFDAHASAGVAVPLPLEQTGTCFLVVDSRIRHDVAAGQYADRRRACGQAAEALGVADLCDAGVEALAKASMPADLLRRARHVITEQQRVAEVVAELAAANMAGVGELLTASHASLRDDFEVSTPELDDIVTTAVAAGAFGARLTGAGFGGCVVVLAPVERAADISAALERCCQVTIYPVWPEAGARRDGGG